jgi:ATP-dependent Lhr-like helicase
MDQTEIAGRLGEVHRVVFGSVGAMRPLQIHTAEQILDGKNVLLSAPTASGKTEAAAAPLLRLALDAEAAPFALWLSPTRALINDLAARLQPRADRLKLRIAVRTGERRTTLANNVAMLLTTPESLDVMLGQEALEARLSAIRVVVLDEVHLLHGTRRGLQTMMLLERLARVTRNPLIRCGLSATVAAPETVAKWMAGSGDEVQVLRGEHARETELHIHGYYRDAVGATIDTLTAGFRKGWRKQLVFTNTKNEADIVYEAVRSRFSEIPSYLHFASLPRDVREASETRFKSGREAICIATSTLELGVDIGDIDGIHMYGAPGSISSFMQRAGRGSRRSNRVDVIALPRTHDPKGRPRSDLWSRDLLTFAGLARASRQGLLEDPPSSEFFSVAVQQAFSIARRHEKTATIPLVRAATAVAPWLNEEMSDKLLAHLESIGYLEHRHGDYYAMTDTGWEWAFSMGAYSNFAGGGEGMPVRFGHDVLETVAWTNRSVLQRGVLVRLKGETWEVKGQSPRGVEVMRPTHRGEPVRPQRAGGAWHLSFELAQAVRDLTTSSDEWLSDLHPKLSPWLTAWRRRFEEVDFNTQMPVEAGEQHRCLTFLGGLGNRLAEIAVQRAGYTARGTEFSIECDKLALRAAHLGELASSLDELAPAMERWVGTTAHFGLLDPELQKREIVTSISDPRVMRELQSLGEKEVQVIPPADPPPLP